jgi:hypothetical protein
LWQHCMTDRFDLTPKVDLNGNIDLVSWEAWPKLRDTINRDAWNDTQGVQPFSFPPVLSCEDMIVRGTQCFWITTKSPFRPSLQRELEPFVVRNAKEPKGYRFESTTNSQVINWRAVQPCMQRAWVVTLDERRHVSFLDPFWLVCLWFARCHETL